jgi:signal transduction histidine kinase
VVDWRAGPVRVRAERGRLAQALGNLLSNAVEHGTGPIRVQATRVGGRVRIEVVNGVGQAHGRGLRIATRAVEECGGTLALERADGRAAAAVELPLAS